MTYSPGKQIIYSLCIILSVLFLSCSPHPSSKFDYYQNIRSKWVPSVKGKLICADTVLVAYEMTHTTAGIATFWWITEQGHRIMANDCLFIEIEPLPNFRIGEELTPFQLKNAQE